ncbi:hypothetical protein [Tepidimonas sp.]|uniref:hypothetical protein n=1 Tax=Tepidimonas sp. TaxID=2002775 RepID=UPI0039193DA5
MLKSPNQALISKGLRQPLLHELPCVLVSEPSPDFKGIKTVALHVLGIPTRSEPSPDFKGIKTGGDVIHDHRASSPNQALISKGLRHRATLDVTIATLCPNQALISKGLRRLEAVHLAPDGVVRTKP